MGGETRDENGWLALTRQERERHESHVAAAIAHRIIQALPTSEPSMQALMRNGYQLAHQMSWDVVAGRFVMPGIEAACRKHRSDAKAAVTK
jgi:hypothetical protein